MIFREPWALLLIPLSLGLYLILVGRGSRRPRPITTWLLFMRANQKLDPRNTRRSPEFKRLLRLLPLWLAVAAWSGPVLVSFQDVSLLALLDRSPSMATRTEQGTRLARALARLRGLGEPYRIVTAGPVSLPADSLEPLARVLPLDELLLDVHARLRRGQRILVVTDRKLPALPQGAGLLQVVDGQPDGGLTSVTLDAQGNLLVRGAARGRPGTRRLEVRLWPHAKDSPRPLWSGSVTHWPFRLVLPGFHPGEQHALEVCLAPPDDNPLDDRVLLAPWPGRILVRLPPKGLEALERAFSADPLVEVRRGPGACALRVGPGEAGHAFARLLLPPYQREGFKTGALRPVRGLMGVQGALATFPLGREEGDDPLYALEQRPPGAQVLVTLGSEPLVVRAGRTLLFLSRPCNSPWRERRSFPLICSELLRLLGLKGGASHRAWPGGSLVKVPSPAPKESRLWVSMRDPGGEETRLLVAGDGFFHLSLQRCGLYHLSLQGTSQAAPGWPRELSCGVLSREAVVGPFAARDELRLPPSRSQEERHPLAAWLIFLALLALLLLEGLPCLAGWRRVSERVMG